MSNEPSSPRSLWAEAAAQSMWPRNHTTMSQIHHSTPYEGPKAWAQTPGDGELDSRGRHGYSISCDAKSKGIQVYWPDTHSIRIKQDAIHERCDPTQIIYIDQVVDKVL